MPTTECRNCEKEFEYDTGPRTPFTEEQPPLVCRDCADDEANAGIAQQESPPGGWPKNTDLDRL